MEINKMNILVFSENNIKNFVTNKTHAVISIQDPDCDFIKLPKNPNCVATSKYKFYDFDSPTGQKNYDLWLFEKQDAEKILEFVESIKNKIELLCVHCVAGISRSAGVAGALSKIYNNDDSYYFKHYCPNMLVYRIILNTYYEKQK